MRFPQTQSELDAYVRKNNFRPVGKWTYRELQIYIAESELIMNKPKEYPWGYYMVSWFVENPVNNADSKFDVGSWLEFDPMHDSEKSWSQRTKQEARINATLAHAQDWIDKNREVERYG